jgi:hypothetical protein
MKLSFFLIAFFLVLIRVCFPWPGHGGHDTGNISMTGDGYIKEIHWSGKIRLSDDEKTIAGISPGGYLKFRENDTTFKAESNLQGEISYQLYDGRTSLSLGDSGKRFVSAILHKVIGFGFDGEGRAERIYKKGGNMALLAEIPHMELDVAKNPYFDLMLKSDSLTKEETVLLLQEIQKEGADVNKQDFLRRLAPRAVKDSSLLLSWLGTVAHLDADFEKQGLLKELIGQGRIEGKGYDSLVGIIGHLDADFQKQDLLKKLIGDSLNTDGQWIELIGAANRLDADFQKADLLVEIAGKMPRTDTVKACYIRAAKTITDDMQYGKVMRAVE